MAASAVNSLTEALGKLNKDAVELEGQLTALNNQAQNVADNVEEEFEDKACGLDITGLTCKNLRRKGEILNPAKQALKQQIVDVSNKIAALKKDQIDATRVELTRTTQAMAALDSKLQSSKRQLEEGTLQKTAAMARTTLQMEAKILSETRKQSAELRRANSRLQGYICVWKNEGKCDNVTTKIQSPMEQIKQTKSNSALPSNNERTVTIYKTSFNCNEDKGLTEQAICQNEELASADIIMSNKYNKARVVFRNLKDSKKYIELVTRQRDFIDRWRSVCGADVDCLVGVYKRRLAELRGDLPGQMDDSTSAPPAVSQNPERIYEPSFNCKEDKGLIEQAICHNAELSHYDRRMGHLYDGALAKFRNLNDGYEKYNELVTEQRSFIGEWRSRCGPDVDCLVEVYRGRLIELGSLR